MKAEKLGEVVFGRTDVVVLNSLYVGDGMEVSKGEMRVCRNEASKVANLDEPNGVIGEEILERERRQGGVGPNEVKKIGQGVDFDGESEAISIASFGAVQLIDSGIHLSIQELLVVADHSSYRPLVRVHGGALLCYESSP